MRPVTAAALLLLLALGCSGPTTESSPSQPPGQAVPAAQPKSPPAYVRLDPDLNRVLASENPLEAAEDAGFKVLEGRIQVNITTTPERVSELVRWLGEHDAQNLLESDATVQAFVPPTLLPDLDGNDAVVRVARPQYAQPLADEPSPSE